MESAMAADGLAEALSNVRFFKMLSTEEKEPDAFHAEEKFMRDWPTNFSTRTVVNTPEYKVTRVRLERIATGGGLCA